MNLSVLEDAIDHDGGQGDSLAVFSSTFSQPSNSMIFLKRSKIVPRSFSRFTAGSGALLCALGFAGGAQGACLSIDLSDPSAVTMVGSGEVSPSSSQPGLDFSKGITLDLFLKAGATFHVGDGPISSSLTSVGSPSWSFTEAFATSTTGVDGVGPFRELNLSNPGGSGIQLFFFIGNPTLTGTAVFNLSALQLIFPTRRSVRRHREMSLLDQYRMAS